MSEGEGFVRAILASPEDVSLRLVYADYLEDHSDPRAGCLRLAARLRANYGPRHPDHSRPFWEKLGRGIEPAWWAEEARRLAEELDGKMGDGRKTAVLIALALAEATLLFPDDWDGRDPVALRTAADQAIEAINRLAVRLGSPAELTRCLRTAALGDEGIADVMYSTFAEVGKDGVIHVEPAPAGRSPERVRVIRQRGLRFPLPGRGEEGLELKQAAVLVSLRPLQAEEVRQVLAVYSQVGAGLLCLCPALDAEGADLFRNAAHNGDPVILCATSSGRWRDCFEDAAVATGARIIPADQKAPVEIRPERLGRAGSARIKAGQLVIDSPLVLGAPRQHWVAHLRQLIEETSGDEQEWHSLRLAQLTGGVATVEVCGRSPQETEQLDGLSCGALHAGRAAIAYGYVPGGGVAYLRGALACREGPASQAMRWALEEPTRALLAGSGMDVRNALARLRADEGLGLDVVGKQLLPWRTEGPIDPTWIVRAVIESAIASVGRAGAAGAP